MAYIKNTKFPVKTLVGSTENAEDRFKRRCFYSVMRLEQFRRHKQ
jgi:hypothetical protein